LNSQLFFNAGYIVKTHGIKGGLIISLDNSVSFEGLEFLYIKDDNQQLPFRIEELRPFKANLYIVYLHGIGRLEEAQPLKGKTILMPESNRIKTEGGFYDDQIITFDVLENDTLLGNVARVEYAGNNRLLVITGASGEILIPIDSPFITSVDLVNRIVYVSLPAGLLDINVAKDSNR